MKLLYAKCGAEILVSDEDYIYLCFSNWSLDPEGYPRETSGPHDRKHLHKIIAKRMNLNNEKDIDHKDRNRLNNQRDNLRAASRSQNNGNSLGHSDRLNQYKGVTYDRGKYKAQFLGKHLGRFKTAKEGAIAYNNAAIKFYGEFAKLNEVILNE